MEERVAFDTATCKGASGFNSGGNDPGALENREPPSRGFLPDDFDLSSSVKLRIRRDLQKMELSMQRTLDPALNGFLNRRLENSALPPDLDHSSQFLLNVGRCAFESGCGCVGNDLFIQLL